MDVRKLSHGEEKLWDDFLRSNEYSTPQQLANWKQVMVEVFKSKAIYLLAEDNGKIVGVLPLFHVKSLITGNYITSVPGGLCAVSEEAAEALLNETKEYVKAVKANYLILRDGRKKWDFPGLVTDESHVTFKIPMSADLNQITQKMKGKTRKLVFRASQDSLSAEVGLNHLSEYYPVYARAMQGMGTPTLGLSFFQSMASHLPHETNLVSIQFQDDVVGGGFIAPFKQTVYCLWSGLLKEFYDLYVSHMLYWEVIKFAHQWKYQYVDIGRCRENSGGYHFKKSFGGEVQRLYQQFYLNGIEKPPTVGAEMEEEMKYRFFTSVWRKLPQTVTEVLGPKLRKQMPFG